MPLNNNMKIKCTTLFDITKTNANPRRRDIDILDQKKFDQECGQQSNFETILQIINLRSQPEDITTPTIEKIKLDKKSRWGSRFQTTKLSIPCWSFEFTIAHSAVFRNDTNELGMLLLDCEGVPMITGLTEFKQLSYQLSTTPEFKNIDFQIL